MADPKRVAAALQYQQQKPAWWDAVPVAGQQGPTTPNEMSWLDRLNELSAGVGTGLTNQLEGYKQLITHPIDTAQQIYQSGKAIVQDPALLAQGLKAMGERAVSSPQGLGEVVGENINPRNLLRNLATPNVNELTVYHGTPHTFPAVEGAPLGKFDASKIGTGEGAQAYGYGIYVAESPDVAGGYAKNVKDNAAIDLINNEMNKLVNVMNADSIAGQYRKFKSDIGKNAAKRYDELMDQRSEIIKKPGSLYTVDLPDEMVDRMLEFEMPLEEMPEKLQKVINPLINKLQSAPNPSIFKNIRSVGDVIQYANALKLEPHKKLQAVGIPGIKYLDAGSRGRGGPGTRNFVIFPGEEQNLTILERK
jgi:hypothetical protein